MKQDDPKQIGTYSFAGACSELSLTLRRKAVGCASPPLPSGFFKSFMGNMQYHLWCPLSCIWEGSSKTHRSCRCKGFPTHSAAFPECFYPTVRLIFK